MEDGIARMGEIVFSNQDLKVLRALGLGSCIGLCVFDPMIKLGCIAHIMLPEARSGSVSEQGKYADTAVPAVIKMMEERGAVKSRLKIAIAGGAQLFNFNGASERLDIGKRNAEAVKLLLKSSNLKISGEDVGGTSGRTVTMDTVTGEVIVRLVGGNEKRLANLGNAKTLN